MKILYYGTLQGQAIVVSKLLSKNLTSLVMQAKNLNGQC
jgi:hypothetical protein